MENNIIIKRVNLHYGETEYQYLNSLSDHEIDDGHIFSRIVNDGFQLGILFNDLGNHLQLSVDFTEEIFRVKGISTKVVRISSAEYKKNYPDSADRPSFSALDNRMFRLNLGYSFKDWKDALEEYLK